MKNFKIFILFIAFFVQLKFVVNEQINQSNTNLNPIEIKTSPNDSKEQILIDKAETKLLPTEKNTSELDDKKTESILDDITDLNDLDDKQKQNLLNQVQNTPDIKDEDSKNSTLQTDPIENKTESNSTETISSTTHKPSVQEVTMPSSTQVSPHTEIIQETTKQATTEEIKSVTESSPEATPAKIEPVSESTPVVKVEPETVTDQKSVEKVETVTVSESTPVVKVEPEQVSVSESTPVVKAEPVTVSESTPVVKVEPEQVSVSESTPVEKVEPVTVSETTPVEKVEPEPVSEPTPTEQVDAKTETVTQPVTESTKLDQTEEKLEPVSEATPTESVTQLSVETTVEPSLTDKTVTSTKSSLEEQDVETLTIPTIYPVHDPVKTEEKVVEKTESTGIPSVTNKPSVDSFSRRFSNKIKKLKNEDTSKEEHHHDHNEIQNETKIEHRVCANLDNFKQILNDKFEPLYLPIVQLLPEDVQLVLLNESFGGLSNASIIFMVLNLGLISSFFILIFKIIEGKKINVNSSLNEQLILQTNRIKQLEFDLRTYVNLIDDNEKSRISQESVLNDKDSTIKDLSEKLTKSLKEQEFTEKEVSKLKSNETKLIKEANQLRSDLNSLNEVFAQQKSVYSQTLDDKDQRINELTEIVNSTNSQMKEYEVQFSDYYQIKDEKSQIEGELTEAKNMIEVLKNSLSLKNSIKNPEIDDYVQVDTEQASMDALMNLAQLQMEYKTLQDKYDTLTTDNDAKRIEIEQLKEQLSKKDAESSQWETKIKKLEKQIKENEMQIRLLNELREKDTKQHLKGLSELDMQLKKKTTDADKVSHYMEQLRVKQERIQELEANLNRVEKQTNQERQTFEKQSHENWLNAKKLDKELKEARQELSLLKERMKQMESGQIQENIVEEPPRPSSTSSNPGMVPPSGFRPFIPPPHFRYPYPPPINPAQAVAFMQQHLEQRLNSGSTQEQNPQRIPVPPNPMYYQRMLQAQQYMQQQHLMNNSANSSQQVSPGELSNSNILASTALNDTSMNNFDNTANYPNDAEFDYSSNSGIFNQNQQDVENYQSNVNVNSNFNV